MDWSDSCEKASTVPRKEMSRGQYCSQKGSMWDFSVSEVRRDGSRLSKVSAGWRFVPRRCSGSVIGWMSEHCCVCIFVREESRHRQGTGLPGIQPRRHRMMRERVLVSIGNKRPGYMSVEGKHALI